MMEAIRKQRELMTKKSINGKKESINNNKQRDKDENNLENKNNIIKTSVKDRIGVFEKSHDEKFKNFDNFKAKEKGSIKKDINKKNINNIKNNNIILTKKPIKDKTQSNSFEKTFKTPKELILQQTTKKCNRTIHILNNIKLNISNFSNFYKKRESTDVEEIIKINEYQPFNRNKTTYTKKDKDKDKDTIKKRNSLLDENNRLTIKLNSKNIYTKEDFEIVNFLGKGAYGTVLQVFLKKDPTKKIYAIKKLDINSLISVNRLYQAYLENDILNELDNPYIVKVYGAFEADEKIHIVMDYMPKGDLAYFIKSNYPLRADAIKFYAAEMVLFLEYMQKLKLIHRDLKPQNIMIDEKGHLKVIDFGTVRKKGYYYDKREMKFKVENIFEIIDSEDIKGVKNVVNPDEEDVDEDDEEEEEEEDDENHNSDQINNNHKKMKVRKQRSMTFVGTAEYISPEVIADKPAEFGTDIWAFGVMLFQMIFNTTPFLAATTYLTFRKIESAKFDFPKDSNDISEEAKDLLKKIFVPDPKKRLGGGDWGSDLDIFHLKKHKFFKNIKWNNLHNITPPGLDKNKFYESKRKSIYKKKSNNRNESDGYSVFDDKSNNNNIKIIKEGYIKKKSSWFHYEKRYIVLDTTPRVVVTYMNDNGNKKVIPLTRKCKVSIVEDNCFDLKTPQKNHRFKGLSNDGNDWAGLIDDVIKGYAKE